METGSIRTEYLGPARSSVLHVSGDINWTTSPDLTSEIENTLEADHPACLIVDLNEVYRIDSSGICALVGGLRQANRMHAKFTLCGVNPSLRNLLQRTRLDQFFEIRQTIHEALRNPTTQ
jgi:anti-anti-sigma factor